MTAYLSSYLQMKKYHMMKVTKTKVQVKRYNIFIITKMLLYYVFTPHSLSWRGIVIAWAGR